MKDGKVLGMGKVLQGDSVDIEMSDAIRTANYMSKATKKHGVCFHNALHNLTCDGCGKAFDSHEHLDGVRADLRAEWC